jgi:hypothetical protein
LQALIAVGALVEGFVALVALWKGGLWAMVAALVGSGVAFAAQVVAVAVLRPGMRAPAAEFTRRWGAGMAVRFGSFVVVAVLILGLRDLLPPLWVATGYLATLLILLFGEYRFLR